MVMYILRLQILSVKDLQECNINRQLETRPKVAIAQTFQVHTTAIRGTNGTNDDRMLDQISTLM